MPIERYLFAIIPEDGYIQDQSPGIDAFSDYTKEYMRTRPIGEYTYWLPGEQCVVHQVVEETEDEAGRDGVWNSAVIIPIKDYLLLTRPHTVLSEYLVPKNDVKPGRLESVAIQ